MFLLQRGLDRKNMNLGKVIGEFQNPKQLIKAILKEHHKYEEEFEEMEGEVLVSKSKLVKVDVVEGDVVVVSLVNRVSEFPIPIIVSSRLSLIFTPSSSFPLKLSGQLKDHVGKEEMSKFLAKVKVALAFPDVSALDTATKEPQPYETTEEQSPSPVPPQSQVHKNQNFLGSSNNSSSIGRSDLDPFAAAPGMVGGYPAGLPSSGGMIVGPDHPMFTNPNPAASYAGIGGVPSFPGSLPIGSVPPGARFDPISPFGPQHGFGNRPRGGFAAPGSRGSRRPPFSGDPDNDAFMPPGQNDFY